MNEEDFTVHDTSDDSYWRNASVQERLAALTKLTAQRAQDEGIDFWAPMQRTITVTYRPPK